LYETRYQAPLTRRRFLMRMLRHASVALAFVAASLGIGIAGYRAFEDLPPLDALLNSAMLLGGMGPVDPPKTSAGKLFASAYALYAGLVFIVTTAVLLTPVLHRLMHRFHWKDDERG
jgi:hypothetical protein